MMRKSPPVLAAVSSALLASAPAAVAAGAPDVVITSDRGQVGIRPSGPPPCARLLPPSVPPTSSAAIATPPCIAYVPGAGQRLDISAGTPLTVTASAGIAPPRIGLFDATGNPQGVIDAVPAGPQAFVFAPLAPGVTHAMFTLPYDDGTYAGDYIYEVALHGIPTPTLPAPGPAPDPLPKPATRAAAKRTLAVRSMSRRGSKARITVQAPRNATVRVKWRAAGRSGAKRVRMTRRSRTVTLAVPRRATRVRVQLAHGKSRVTKTFKVKRSRS